MRIPFEWLKEFVDIDDSIESAAEKLSMSGTEVSSTKEDILEIETLPNRGDCLCVKGVANEVCAIYHKRLKFTPPLVKETGEDINKLASVEVEDKDLCPRYMARAVTNVKIKESPQWLQKRLLDAGMRPINNIVDITNYVLLELGQPLHAFDLDKIEGRKIIVRRASNKEKFTTLDGVERELSADNLLIADSKRGVALAGVMGGSNSEVSSSTKNILLESAYFNPVSINKTSKQLKIWSESSMRFERGVDFDNAAVALDRAAGLIAELSEGSVAKGFIDLKSEDRKPKEITLRLGKIKKVLGIEVEKNKAVSILEGLGFSVKDNKDDLNITIPLNRAGDIEREIDVIEEIARLWGYEKIPATYPHIENSNIEDDGTRKISAKEKCVRQTLAANGFNEAKTYSMLGKKLFEKAFLSPDRAVEITNPLIEEMTHLRTSLIAGLLEAAEYNSNRQMHDIALFETGKVFCLENNEIAEKTFTAAVLTGSVWRGAVEKDKVNEDFYFVKGIVESILDIYGAGGISYEKSLDPRMHPANSARVFLAGVKIGFVGQLNEAIRKNFGLHKGAYVFEIDMDSLNANPSPVEKSYRPVSKFPSIRRDIAMFVPLGVSHENIIKNIISAGGKLVEEAELFDKFSAKGAAQGSASGEKDGRRISLAYSVIYRDPKKTLTDDEVNSVHERVLLSLENDLKVEIRK